MREIAQRALEQYSAEQRLHLQALSLRQSLAERPLQELVTPI